MGFVFKCRNGSEGEIKVVPLFYCNQLLTIKSKQMDGKNFLNSVKMTKPKLSVFDLSHEVKMSCQMGDLVPILCMEVVPSDRVRINNEIFMRFQPLLSPMMQRVDLTCHTFFVPWRILWPNWEKYWTNTKLDDTDALPVFPFIQYSAATAQEKLGNYLGLPHVNDMPAVGAVPVSAMAFAAYQCCFSELYRDQNLMQEVEWELIDGLNPVTELQLLRRRAWEHDYFTACLPFAQKGDAVELPLGNFNDVPVLINATHIDPTQVAFQWDGVIQSAGTPATAGVETGTPIQGTPPTIGLAELYARTSDLVTEAALINDLRRAFRLQEWLEKNARGGTRYIEAIRSHFGITSSDKRFQRPEYITGYKKPVQISEVLNTAGSVDPVGTMSGHGIAAVRGNRGSFFVEEHGYIITIMSVLPRTAYFQGVPKMFSKITHPTENLYPSFVHLGEQAVLNKELYVNHSDPDGEFGYLPMYAEYRYMHSRVAGDMASSLDFWHQARKFDTEPVLDAAFVTSDPTQRVFAVTGTEEDKLICHIYNEIKAVRPLPKYGTPTF